jgi:hypothetical protein
MPEALTPGISSLRRRESEKLVSTSSSMQQFRPLSEGTWRTEASSASSQGLSAAYEDSTNELAPVKKGDYQTSSGTASSLIAPHKFPETTLESSATDISIAAPAVDFGTPLHSIEDLPTVAKHDTATPVDLKDFQSWKPIEIEETQYRHSSAASISFGTPSESNDDTETVIRHKVAASVDFGNDLTHWPRIVNSRAVARQNTALATPTPIRPLRQLSERGVHQGLQPESSRGPFVDLAQPEANESRWSSSKAASVPLPRPPPPRLADRKLLERASVNASRDPSTSRASSENFASSQNFGTQQDSFASSSLQVPAPTRKPTRPGNSFVASRFSTDPFVDPLTAPEDLESQQKGYNLSSSFASLPSSGPLDTQSEQSAEIEQTVPRPRPTYNRIVIPKDNGGEGSSSKVQPRYSLLPRIAPTPTYVTAASAQLPNPFITAKAAGKSSERQLPAVQESPSASSAVNTSSPHSFVRRPQQTPYPSLESVPSQMAVYQTLSVTPPQPRGFLQKNLAIRCAFIVLIAGGVTALIGGGLLHQRLVEGHALSTDDRQLCAVIIGVIIFIIGAFCLLIIFLNRTNFLSHFLNGRMGISESMADRVRSEVELDNLSHMDTGTGVESSVESFSSANPLLLQRPEPVHLRGDTESGTSSVASSVTEDSLQIEPIREAAEERTIVMNLSERTTGNVARVSKFREEFDLEMQEIDPDTGMPVKQPPKRQSFAQFMARRFSGGW